MQKDPLLKATLFAGAASKSSMNCRGENPNCMKACSYLEGRKEMKIKTYIYNERWERKQRKDKRRKIEKGGKERKIEEGNKTFRLCKKKRKLKEENIERGRINYKKGR